MHGDRLADDKSIADQFSDSLSRVCVGDFIDFVWVEPDLAFAAADDRRREALLSAEIRPGKECVSRQIGGSGTRLMTSHKYSGMNGDGLTSCAMTETVSVVVDDGLS